MSRIGWRPAGLDDEECRHVCQYAMERLGHAYDLKNVLDLARYLLPVPPVPVYWRRRMLALGSGDPTRAICPTLIAQAFQSVRYPKLALVEQRGDGTAQPGFARREIHHIRHYSLFAPRDFDISPFFQIVKPTQVEGFDHHQLIWADAATDAEPASWASLSG